MPSPVLAEREFRFLFFTRLFASMALQAQAVVVGWQVYQISSDPLLLGLVGLVEAGPAILGAFFAGHLVDIHRPAKVYALSLSVLLLNTILLWMAAAPQVALDGSHRLILLFIGVFISGAARSFSSPAAFSILPRLVPRELLSSAAAWSSSAYQFASILGPAVGGLIYGSFGPLAGFGFPPVMMAAALACCAGFSEKTRGYRNAGLREPFAKSLRAGIHFALHHRVLLSAMLLDMFSVLFGGAVAVLPMFSDQVLRAGPLGLGFLRAAPSVGSVVVGVFMAMQLKPVISGRRLMIVVAGFGIATIGFALSHNFYLAFFLLVLTGAFDGVSMVIRQTFLQLLTPEEMRGRISALSSIFITSSNEIGAFESGVAARLMGLIPSLVFGGIMTLVVVSGVAVAAPDLRDSEY